MTVKQRERDTPRYLGSILLPNFGCFDWFNFPWLKHTIQQRVFDKSYWKCFNTSSINKDVGVICSSNNTQSQASWTSGWKSYQHTPLSPLTHCQLESTAEVTWRGHGLHRSWYVSRSHRISVIMLWLAGLWLFCFVQLLRWYSSCLNCFLDEGVDFSVP